jgi:hypothetical protein
MLKHQQCERADSNAAPKRKSNNVSLKELFPIDDNPAYQQ